MHNWPKDCRRYSRDFHWRCFFYWVWHYQQRTGTWCVAIFPPSYICIYDSSHASHGIRAFTAFFHHTQVIWRAVKKIKLQKNAAQKLSSVASRSCERQVYQLMFYVLYYCFIISWYHFFRVLCIFQDVMLNSYLNVAWRPDHFFIVMWAYKFNCGKIKNNRITCCLKKNGTLTCKK